MTVFDLTISLNPIIIGHYRESIMCLGICYTCNKFQHFIAESGICTLPPSRLIDMWDTKCKLYTNKNFKVLNKEEVEISRRKEIKNVLLHTTLHYTTKEFPNIDFTL